MWLGVLGPLGFLLFMFVVAFLTICGATGLYILFDVLNNGLPKD